MRLTADPLRAFVSFFDSLAATLIRWITPALPRRAAWITDTYDNAGALIMSADVQRRMLAHRIAETTYGGESLQCDDIPNGIEYFQSVDWRARVLSGAVTKRRRKPRKAQK